MNKQNTSIVFTGDIGFSRYMLGKWADPELLSDDIVEFFRQSDHVVANVEGAVIDAETAKTAGKGEFCHYMDAAAISVLKQIRADIWDIANNHCMDVGAFGLECTMRHAAEAGCQTVGAGSNLDEASRPIILDEAGGIGILALGYYPECPDATESKAGVFTPNLREELVKRIREIKETCRWCIIVSHDGEEFTNLPQPYTRERYLEYLSMGADIVVAHHPHVTMNYELLDNKAIFYSLGNFIFDTDYQRAQHNTEYGVLLKLHFTPDKFTFDALGTTILRGEEHIVASDVPAVFANIPQEEYEALLPLSAQAFVKAEMARKLFLYPERFKEYTTEQWEQFLLSTERKELLPNYRMDFSVILPLSKQDPKPSSLTAVAEYLKKQL